MTEEQAEKEYMKQVGENQLQRNNERGIYRKPDSFETKLTKLINEFSLENGSNTQDHVLAQYLNGCLKLFDKTMSLRDRYSGIYKD